MPWWGWGLGYLAGAYATHTVWWWRMPQLKIRGERYVCGWTDSSERVPLLRTWDYTAYHPECIVGSYRGAYTMTLTTLITLAFWYAIIAWFVVARLTDVVLDVLCWIPYRLQGEPGFQYSRAYVRKLKKLRALYAHAQAFVDEQAERQLRTEIRELLEQ